MQDYQRYSSDLIPIAHVTIRATVVFVVFIACLYSYAMITGNPVTPDENGLLEFLQVLTLFACAILCLTSVMKSDDPLVRLLAFILMCIVLIFIVREMPRCTLEEPSLTCIGKPYKYILKAGLIVFALTATIRNFKVLRARISDIVSIQSLWFVSLLLALALLSKGFENLSKGFANSSDTVMMLKYMEETVELYGALILTTIAFRFMSFGMKYRSQQT